jgi:hypothetical protein
LVVGVGERKKRGGRSSEVEALEKEATRLDVGWILHLSPPLSPTRECSPRPPDSSQWPLLPLLPLPLQ